MRKITWHDGWQFRVNGGEWTDVTVPHDASQVMGRCADAPSGTGGAFYRGGVYEYRRTFVLTEEECAGSLILELEGVYPRAEVRLNDRPIGTCEYGYLGYFFEMKGMEADSENELTVRIDDTNRPDSRWYSGAGLYRPVHLHAGSRAYIPPEGIRVRTISTEPAEVEVTVQAVYDRSSACGQGAPAGREAAADGAGCLPEAFGSRIRIKKDGMTVAQADTASLLPAARLRIPEAELWDAGHPELYECEVTLLDPAGEAVDTAEVRFGIREIAWSPKGFFINGKETLLRGGCVHHDNGVIGARSCRESEYRKIRRLKEFGFNAIRSAHNPASKALLEACDELGMYVMDEGWDMWYSHKTPHDYAERFMEYWHRDVRAIISRDYNHPSVVMYSIGNEVTEPAEEAGVALAKEIADAFRAEDPTRAVTAGINITLIAMQAMGINLTMMDDEAAKARSKKQVTSTEFNEMAQGNAARMNQAAASEQADALTADLFTALDIAGYNYADSRYPTEGEKHPERIVVGSETYAWKLYENWEMVKKYPYLIGDFMWTSWDYIGENGIGAWSWEEDGASFYKGYPWKLGDTGAIDILGNDNAEAGYAAVIWGAQDIYVGVVPVCHDLERLCRAMWRGTNAIPHWSWRGCEGRPAQVEVYGSGSSAVLFINGREAGREPLRDKRAVFTVPYESGELRAVICDEQGVTLAEKTLRSADGQRQLRLQREEKLTDDGLVYIDVDIVGSNGEIECNTDETVRVTVEGGELLGFGSANPKTAEEFPDGSYTTRYGRALAAVRRTAAVTRLKAESRQAGNAEVIL